MAKASVLAPFSELLIAYWAEAIAKQGYIPAPPINDDGSVYWSRLAGDPSGPDWHLGTWAGAEQASNRGAFNPGDG